MVRLVLHLCSAVVLLPLCSGLLVGEDHRSHNRESDFQRILQGFKISPVPLRFNHKNWQLVGLGSYIVNAQGGCNDCHTTPSYAEGGDPHLGQPEQINTKNYLAGGALFGPFVARNLTPDTDTGKPAGLTFKEFKQEMRTGIDLDQEHPEISNLLQVMPWPVYGKMSDHDLRAIYEYLKAIPHAEPAPPAAAARQP